MTSNIEPSMTYRGTTGHTGTSTSYAQATDRRQVGKVQNAVLQEIYRSNYVGRTVAELRRQLPEHHHGSISSALTNLHRAGKIARLTTIRNKAKVYVGTGFVDGRATEQPKHHPANTICPHCGGEVPL